jgi:hypothetical protein
MPPFTRANWIALTGLALAAADPRWESRDQRTERAYTEALAEYNRLWASPDISPGGMPPAVAFLGDSRGMENKGEGTGDLTLALSCRNVGGPVDLVIYLTKGVRSASVVENPS